ncbi:cupin domain-containing protein [Microbacterium sp. C7(2022)]|uniref:cupin domain-containing protein n=1 Tax=Microbacterium sp. C7(2022) TaxID=2992759 RepID=UPI00237A5F0C|nr:cupin domain-containing protein [Microbacterium sp. C7(2022)]MDE0546653.1 cupin domain-containing protein [Microbacterium sp. C7(2022)]
MTPLFPGGVAVSDLHVYDWEAEDGCRGGSPHLHTASSEGYVVTGGSGEVHTLTPAGHEVHALTPGEVVWFSPGTVHRLVNHGDLALIVVMQNSGLPEAGDAVLTFPSAVLDDPEAYAAAAALPSDPAVRADAARARRDLAMRGYLELREAIDARGAASVMSELHQRAAVLVQPRVAQWQQRWESTVEAETSRTRAQLAALAAGESGLMTDAAVARATPNPGPRAYGMCGRLQTWEWE